MPISGKCFEGWGRPDSVEFISRSFPVWNGKTATGTWETLEI